MGNSSGDNQGQQKEISKLQPSLVKICVSKHNTALHFVKLLPGLPRFHCLEVFSNPVMKCLSSLVLFGTMTMIHGATDWKPWHVPIPADIPFPWSTHLSRFMYDDAKNPQYGGADTWYPSWSKQGDLFTPWTDGTVNGITAMSLGSPYNCSQGFARVVGEDPSNLTVTDVGTFHCSTWPYKGRYPSANFYHEGVWYYGTYALDVLSGNAQYPCHNWCVQGPFVGFRYSTDQGKTWTEPRMQMKDVDDNLFGEPGPHPLPNGVWTGKVKFGAPHVVDLGRELEYSPDGFMYLVGHGADKDYQPQSWMQGSQVYLARVLPKLEHILNRDSWQFFGGKDSAGRDKWAPTVALAQPLYTWENRTGVVTMTYIPAIQKYVMCVGTPTYSPNMQGPFDVYFLESDAITGPFKMTAYLAQFGPEAYFVNLPSKFVSPEVVTDAHGNRFIEAALSYSANYALRTAIPKPRGSGYHWSLLPIRFAVSQ